MRHRASFVFPKSRPQRSPFADQSGFLSAARAAYAQPQLCPSLAQELRIAIDADDVKEVERLLRLGADPNTVWGGAWHHLHTDRNIVLLLLQYGANPHAQDVFGRNALHILMGSQNVEAIHRLLDAGVAVNAQTRHSRKTPLFLAAERDEDLEVFRLLFAHGADPNLKDSEGKTPIDVIALRWPPQDEKTRAVAVAFAEAGAV